MTIDYALTACFGYGTADFLSGFATRRQSVAATLLIGQPVALIAIGIAAALTPGHPNWPDMALGVLAGTVGGVGKTLLYQSLARDTMAMASTVFGILSAAVPVTAGLLFGNRLSWLQIAGMVLAVHAIYALQHSHHASPRQQFVPCCSCRLRRAAPWEYTTSSYPAPVRPADSGRSQPLAPPQWSVSSPMSWCSHPRV
jgi:hypothetical protein